MRGHGQRNISACSFSRQAFLCNVLCLIRRFTFLFFASFRALLATELGPETWTSLAALFGGDTCMAFLEIWCLYHCTAQTWFLSMCRLLGARRGLSRWGWARLGRWLSSSLSMVWSGMAWYLDDFCTSLHVFLSYSAPCSSDFSRRDREFEKRVM